LAAHPRQAEVEVASKRFEDELLEVLSGEIGARPEGAHLTTRDLRRLACGRSRLDELERLGAHFANCASCRSRYDAVRRERGISREERCETRSAVRKRLLLRYIAIASAVVAVVAVFLVLRDRPPAPGAAVSSPTARGALTPQAARDGASTLDPRTFVEAVHAFDAYPPSRAAAYTIGLLRQYGVPLSSSALAFNAATVYVTEPGDSWQSVAAKTLGDAALWPIIVLLNLEKTVAGEFVPANTYLRIPQTLSGTGGKE
jgi:hypothetical protein